MPRVGVLALQGSVEPHVQALEACGASAQRLRLPADLEDLDAMVLPGGESTTISLLLHSSGLFEPLRKRISAGMPVLATCAGVIVLASEIVDGQSDQVGMDLLKVKVRRNGYGSQVASFEAPVLLPSLGEAFPGIFIRAPALETLDDQTKVLGTLADGSAVLLEQGQILAASFHPELTGDLRIHQHFLSKISAY
ncbi:MAG: pyridoxal 5'-phosphate synthase glutaminase subunit PdxT [Actinomycetes bacterium]